MSKQKYKIAYLWCGISRGNNEPFSDLYFSSPEEWAKRYKPQETDTLVTCWVPVDFNDWDYIPDLY